MSQQPATDAEHSVPRFNVTVRMRPNTSLESLELRALHEVGMAPEKVAVLMRALRSGPQAMVGKEVTRDRVDAAKEDFEQIGLEVIVTPVLTIQAVDPLAWDKGYKCPACDQHVTLPDNRQCPACNVFVDKVTKEFLLRKKIMEQERGKMEMLAAKQAADIELHNTRSMEDAIRRQIRDELEEEFGIRSANAGLFSGRPGLIRAIGMLTLLGGAFAGGNFTHKMLNPPAAVQANASNAGDTTPQDVDKLLDSTGAKSGAAADAGNGSGAGSAGLAGEVGPEPDMDDSLVASAGQGRAGGKTVTIEQAVAAANALSGSIGGPTTHTIDAKTGAMTAGASVGTSGSSSTPAGAPVPTGASVSPLTKIALTAEFAIQLAEMGQTARANEVIKVLMGTPGLGADPQASALAAQANLQVRAWMITGRNESRTRDQLEALRNGAATIDSASDRAIALARCASILGRNPQLPKQVSTAFLTLASDAAKAAKTPAERNAASNELLIAMAESTLAEINDKIQRGMSAQAQTASSHLDAIVRQGASGAVGARLFAIDYQAKQALGMANRAAESLTTAVSRLEQEPNIPLRAALLRSMANGADIARNENIQAAATRLTAAAEAKSNTEKAEALTELALFYADAGMQDKYQVLAKNATEVSGLTSQEAGAIGANVLVKGNMSAARSFHRANGYQEAELRIKKVAGYLL